MKDRLSNEFYGPFQFPRILKNSPTFLRVETVQRTEVNFNRMKEVFEDKLFFQYLRS